MKYRIISNKLYQINDDNTLTELSNFNSKTNLIIEIRKNTEKPIKEEKARKDKEEKDKKIKTKDIENIPTILETPKKKRGRPKKEEI